MWPLVLLGGGLALVAARGGSSSAAKSSPRAGRLPLDPSDPNRTQTTVKVSGPPKARPATVLRAAGGTVTTRDRRGKASSGNPWDGASKVSRSKTATTTSKVAAGAGSLAEAGLTASGVPPWAADVGGDVVGGAVSKFASWF